MDSKDPQYRSALEAIKVLGRLFVHLSVHKMISGVMYQTLNVTLGEPDSAEGTVEYRVLLLGFQILTIESILKLSWGPSWLKNLPSWVTVDSVHVVLSGLACLITSIGTVMYVQNGAPDNYFMLLSFVGLSILNLLLILLKNILRRSSVMTSVHKLASNGSVINGLAVTVVGYLSQTENGFKNTPTIFALFTLYYVLYVLYHASLANPLWIGPNHTD